MKLVRYMEGRTVAAHSRLVVVVSDCTDVAFAEMRGAIRTAACDTLVEIEPLVPVHAFSVTNAAFVTKLVVEAYPPGTIVSVVVNAIAERTERIAGRLARKDIIFEGTNTGQFGWLLDEYGASECHELNDPGFLPFGGKYVHAPAVGRIAAGAPLNSLGTPFATQKVRGGQPLQGELVHIDNFGNGKFPWDRTGWRYGDRIRVDVGRLHLEGVYWKRMMERSDSEWVIYPGSSFGLTEIGQVRALGLLQSGVQPGDTMRLLNLSRNS